MVRSTRQTASRFAVLMTGPSPKSLRNNVRCISFTLAFSPKTVIIELIERKGLAGNSAFMRGGVGAVVMGILVTGCSQGGPSVIDKLPKDHDPAPVHTILPSPPIECDGINDISRALELIASGRAVALVSATITAEPGPVENVARTVPVESYTLLAGQLPSGPVRQVEESAANDKTNSLEPGSYLVLLGETGQESAYFLSDGLRGSFVVDGVSAYEQCPNYADPDHPTIVRTGITDIQELSDLFAKAFADDSRG